MEYKDIVTQIKAIGLPSVYHHWDHGKVPQLPYIIHMMLGRDDSGADNINYSKVQNVAVELYSRYPDTTNEEEIENIIEQMGLFYEKSEPIFIETENMYLTRYEFKFMKGK